MYRGLPKNLPGFAKTPPRGPPPLPHRMPRRVGALPPPPNHPPPGHPPIMPRPRANCAVILPGRVRAVPPRPPPNVAPPQPPPNLPNVSVNTIPSYLRNFPGELPGVPPAPTAPPGFGPPGLPIPRPEDVCYNGNTNTNNTNNTNNTKEFANMNTDEHTTPTIPSQEDITNQESIPSTTDESVDEPQDVIHEAQEVDENEVLKQESTEESAAGRDSTEEDAMGESTPDSSGSSEQEAGAESNSNLLPQERPQEEVQQQKTQKVRRAFSRDSTGGSGSQSGKPKPPPEELD